MTATIAALLLSVAAAAPAPMGASRAPAAQAARGGALLHVRAVPGAGERARPRHLQPRSPWSWRGRAG